MGGPLTLTIMFMYAIPYSLKLSISYIEYIKLKSGNVKAMCKSKATTFLGGDFVASTNNGTFLLLVTIPS